jgi:hypothetical protein
VDGGCWGWHRTDLGVLAGLRRSFADVCWQPHFASEPPILEPPRSRDFIIYLLLCDETPRARCAHGNMGLHTHSALSPVAGNCMLPSHSGPPLKSGLFLLRGRRSPSSYCGTPCSLLAFLASGASLPPSFIALW